MIPVGQVDVDPGVAMAGEEVGQARRELAVAERHRRGEADLPPRRGLEPGHGSLGIGHLLDDPLAAAMEDLAHLGEAHAPRGPAQELGAQPLLEGRDLAADGGFGDPELPGGRR